MCTCLPLLANQWLLLLVCMTGGMIESVDAVRAMARLPPPLLTRSNFLQAAVHGGRHRHLSCSDDPGVCFDREKNPWGGTTCCFQRLCKDTESDRNHCGGCGQRCAYGLSCCSGHCIDLRTDPAHCGSCYDACLPELDCRFGMCDYNGGEL